MPAPDDSHGIPRILVAGTLFSLLVLGVIIGVAVGARGDGVVVAPPVAPARDVSAVVVATVVPRDGEGAVLPAARARALEVSFATVRRVNGDVIPARRVLAARTDVRGRIRLVGFPAGRYAAVAPDGAYAVVSVPARGGFQIPLCLERCAR